MIGSFVVVCRYGLVLCSRLMLVGVVWNSVVCLGSLLVSVLVMCVVVLSRVLGRWISLVVRCVS